MTAAELIAKLDAACLGRTPEQSLRKVGNGGVPLMLSGGYYSTHVAADLALMADVIEEARNA